MSLTANPLTLLELTERIAAGLERTPGLKDVWVVAETSDLRVNRHCYMELIQKDSATGQNIARLRATIWASAFPRIDAKFYAATGAHLATGLKVMLQLSVTFHPAYGLSANITDIDPAYTLGDIEQRRAQILQQLKADGIIDANRLLPWPDVALRIAVVSAKGAAGYGDFIHQLYTNRACLAFKTQLFEALMQGADAPASVYTALAEIADRLDQFDCVVIIRGGGAVSDLASFDNLDLAAAVAQFPIPVIVGIGHERDVTVLDFVANMRVKTPTAAAEWLIAKGENALARIAQTGQLIARVSTTRLADEAQQLARIQALIPSLARNLITRQSDRLQALETLLQTLKPEATLRRGFSITRANGHAITDTEALRPGTQIETILANGTIQSTITTSKPNK